MATASRTRRLAVAAAVTALGILGLTGCTPETGQGAPESGRSAPATSDQRLAQAIPTGTVGAAYLDDGYLRVGDGETIVDVYFDPMCPVCGTFEKANRDLLADGVDDSQFTLRLHPMTFLNRVSQGTDYSTRAGNALTCVAAADPSKVLPYFEFLYSNQPEENSPGLDDATLIEMASAIGALDISVCVNDVHYSGWVQKVNDDALAGPIEGADIKKIEGTPTVLVNGASYRGAVDDEDALADFIAAAR